MTPNLVGIAGTFEGTSIQTYHNDRVWRFRAAINSYEYTLGEPSTIATGWVLPANNGIDFGAPSFFFQPHVPCLTLNVGIGFAGGLPAIPIPAFNRGLYAFIDGNWEFLESWPRAFSFGQGFVKCVYRMNDGRTYASVSNLGNDIIYRRDDNITIAF